MSNSAGLRAEAAKLISEVVHHGKSLSDNLSQVQAAMEREADRRLLGALVYGSLRWYSRMDGLLSSFLGRPVPRKQQVLNSLMVCGLYEQHYLSTPDHAVVSETVTAARMLGHPRAAGMVNAILRRSQREGAKVLLELDQQPALRHAHPSWLLERIRQDWPACWEDILSANNLQAPFWLRVNLQQGSRADYAGILETECGRSATLPAAFPAALVLDQGMDVERLPGFDSGRVSVQDGAAQLAGSCLEPRAGERVLDACAAPGNKTAHLFEMAGGTLDLLALDHSSERLERLRKNLLRTGYRAQVLEADASAPDSWWDGRPFDKILLDAPCSATGVIRRHPDIKWLRRGDDIPVLAGLQAKMIRALWPLLARGGRLVYTTCSVLREENERVVSDFLACNDDVEELNLPVLQDVASRMQYGYQILPGDSAADGFYYVALIKR
ncbi:MAG: 16S rRNA (cytosine(967)-C(5))-methyltransferase RsmB [Gammaproteobacteria bacterium]|jgi:16S rRNA (cytosine967-C5)-methyltransferase|nr:16S rRNA (cytosine(967)-C(5))-methyltransferase RsmB [Gammaproteobacteria bacterium]